MPERNPDASTNPSKYKACADTLVLDLGLQVAFCTSEHCAVLQNIVPCSSAHQFSLVLIAGADMVVPKTL